ncbi:FecCD family ABC transporter permease [Treponema sp.]|uniref:FecCD family ABC transporter permease n=1 Tax=Treponema sp. TaxID=166 RepID=UPI003EFC1DC6
MKKIALFSIFATSILLSLVLGAEKINAADLFCSGDTFSKTILFDIRLPRVFLCILSGAMLGGSGAIFQLFFRNPLAEPGIMGISSGATAGAVFAACFGLPGAAGLSALSTGAFIGALISGILAVAVAGKKSPATLLLCGTALGALYSAFSSIAISVNSRQLHSMYMWMLGTLSGRGWDEVLFILPLSAAAVFLSVPCIGKLDILSCGEVTAVSLGLSVKKLQYAVIISGALAVSAAVCAGGTIGFIGLIAPHITRKFFGAKAKVTVPLSMVTGAALLALSDTLCRTILAPSELPVGTVTALLGAPFFLSLLLSKKRVTNA